MEPATQCLTLAATPSQLFPLHLHPISTLKASRFVFIFDWKLLTCLEHKQQGDGRSFYFLLPSFTLQGMQGIWPALGQPLLGLLGLYSGRQTSQASQASFSPGMSIKTPCLSLPEGNTGSFSQILAP